MSTENEDEEVGVKYSFTGDVSSLRDATEKALELLGKYGSALKQAGSSGGNKFAQRSEQSLNASVKRMIKDVDGFKAKLQGVGDVKLPRGSSSNQEFGNAIQTLNTQLTTLGSTERITTTTLSGMQKALKGTAEALKATTPQVDKLVASEQRYQNVLATVYTKSTQFGQGIESLRNKVSGVFAPITAKLHSMASAFDPIKAKVQAFKDHAAIAFQRVGNIVGAVSQAFRRTSQEADGSADAQKSLGSALRETAKGFKKQAESIDVADDELEDFNTTAQQTTKTHSKLSSILGSIGRSFTTSFSAANRTTNSFKSLSTASELLRRGFNALVGIGVSSWLAQCTSSTIDYVETLNLFNVAMGASLDVADAFINKMSELYGMDPKSLMESAGIMYLLTDAINMPAEASTKMALNLTKAANDVSSLYNISIDRVTTNFESGLMGMTRAVKAYGFDITEATLQQVAYSQGLTESVTTMTEANKRALRYLSLMGQMRKSTQQLTTDVEGNVQVMGDFARTIEQPANQLRIFKEQMSQLGRAIGNYLIAPLAKSLAYINGFVMSLRVVLTYIAQLVGIMDAFDSVAAPETAEEMAEGLDGVATSADAAAKAIQSLTTPYDELNILSDNSSSSTSADGAKFEDALDPALLAAIESMDLSLETIQMKANKIRDTILGFLGFSTQDGSILGWDPEAFEANLIAKFPKWTEAIQSTFDHWTSIVDAFKQVFKGLLTVFQALGKKISKVLKKAFGSDDASDFIGNLTENLKVFSDWMTKNADAIASMVLTFVGLKLAFQALSTIIPIIGGVSQAVSFLITACSSLGPVLLWVAAIAAVAAAIAILYNNNAAFAAWFDNLMAVIASTMKQFWEDSLKPLLDKLWNALTSMWEGLKTLGGVLLTLWTEVFGPILSAIGDGVVYLWNRILWPIIEKIIEIVGGLIEVLMALWNNVLGPMVNWLIKAFGPSVVDIFKYIWDVVVGVVTGLGDTLFGLLQILGGVIDFLAGVFTGDWKRAWKGIVNIGVGLVNSLAGLVEVIVNVIIAVLNGLWVAISESVRAVLNLILGAIEGIAEWVGIDLNIKLTGDIPKIPELRIPRVPELAAGGIATGPTLAMVGEGEYEEAIMPLEGSPQMEKLVERIADAVTKKDTASGGDSSQIIKVYLDSREITSAQNRANRMYGKTLQTV